MSELEDAKQELYQALAPLKKSDPSDPLSDLLKAAERLKKANPASSSLTPGEGPAAEASKGDAAARNKAVDKSRSTTAEARGDSPRGGKDTRYGEHAELDDSDTPEADMDTYLPNENPDQASIRGKSPKTAKGALTKAMKQAPPEEEDPEEEEAEEEAQEGQEPQDDQEEEPEEDDEEEQAPPPPPMKKSKKVLTPAPIEEDFFKSIASHDEEGIHLDTIDGSDALTYLTDEFVKSLADVAAHSQANDEALSSLISTQSTTLTKSLKTLKDNQITLNEKIDELTGGLTALMKSQASLMTLMQSGSYVGTPVQGIPVTQSGTPLFQGNPPPPPTMAPDTHSPNKYFNQGRYFQMDRFQSKSEEPIVKSMGSQLPAGTTKTQVAMILEKGINSKRLHPQYLGWLDSRGIEATIDAIPADVRLELGL